MSDWCLRIGEKNKDLENSCTMSLDNVPTGISPSSAGNNHGGVSRSERRQDPNEAAKVGAHDFLVPEVAIRAGRA